MCLYIQCVAECCKRVAVCCKRVAVCCYIQMSFENIYHAIGGTFRCACKYSVLQSVASVLQCVECLLRTSTVLLHINVF